jgi:hypothetical protein
MIAGLDRPANQQETQHGDGEAGQQQNAQRIAPGQAGHQHEDGDLGQHAERPQGADLGLAVTVISQMDGIEDIERTMRRRHRKTGGEQRPHLWLAKDVADCRTVVGMRHGGRIRDDCGEQDDAGQNSPTHPEHAIER